MAVTGRDAETDSKSGSRWFDPNAAHHFLTGSIEKKRLNPSCFKSQRACLDPSAASQSGHLRTQALDPSPSHGTGIGSHSDARRRASATCSPVMRAARVSRSSE